jgi:hypothetical protein
MFSALLIGIKKLLALALVIVFIIQAYNPQQYPILVSLLEPFQTEKERKHNKRRVC